MYDVFESREKNHYIFTQLISPLFHIVFLFFVTSSHVFVILFYNECDMKNNNRATDPYVLLKWF